LLFHICLYGLYTQTKGLTSRDRTYEVLLYVPGELNTASSNIVTIRVYKNEKIEMEETVV
jgi:hypothetical protein